MKKEHSLVSKCKCSCCKKLTVYPKIFLIKMNNYELLCNACWNYRTNLINKICNFSYQHLKYRFSKNEIEQYDKNFNRIFSRIIVSQEK